MRTYLSNYDVGLFEMDDVNLLCRVFDEAWAAAEAAPSVYLVDEDLDHARNALARFIIETALEGERSAANLKAAGLKRLASYHRNAAARDRQGHGVNSPRAPA